MKSIKSELSNTIKNKLGSNVSYQQLMNDACSDPDVQAFIQKYSISNDVIRHSASKIYEFVQQKKKTHRADDGLIPGYQPRLVFNGELIDVSYEPTLETQAKQRSSALKKRIRSIGMPKDAKRATFKKFDYDNNNYRLLVLQASMEFAERYGKETNRYHQAMYLFGPFGVGKTYALGATANELAKQNVSTTMVHFPSFAAEMKQSIQDHTLAGKLDSVKKAPVLMLDDVGADVMSRWVRDEIFALILEYRMQNELPTFFSSNLSMNEFEGMLADSGNETDRLRAKRIMQRVRYLAKEYRLNGENRRPQ
ncbi:primosomal protein DnaI [Lactobacillaceae bacterium Scapto_B20]